MGDSTLAPEIVLEIPEKNKKQPLEPRVGRQRVGLAIRWSRERGWFSLDLLLREVFAWYSGFFFSSPQPASKL